MAIFEQDLVKKMAGNKEREITNTDAIRFEVGNNSYTVTITEEGIAIYKIGRLDGIIEIVPLATNKIIIK